MRFRAVAGVLLALLSACAGPTYRAGERPSSPLALVYLSARHYEGPVVDRARSAMVEARWASALTERDIVRALATPSLDESIALARLLAEQMLRDPATPRRLYAGPGWDEVARQCSCQAAVLIWAEQGRGGQDFAAAAFVDLRSGEVVGVRVVHDRGTAEELADRLL